MVMSACNCALTGNHSVLVGCNCNVCNLEDLDLVLLWELSLIWCYSRSGIALFRELIACALVKQRGSFRESADV